MSTRVLKLRWKLVHMSTRRKKKERKKERNKERKGRKGKKSKEKKERGERTSMFQEARFSVATAFVGRTDAGAQSIVSVFGWWDARCWGSPECWFGLRLLTYFFFGSAAVGAAQ